jgi:release factor glutamine methyltransferase
MNEAEIVFSRILGCDRLWLYLNKNRRLKKKAVQLASAVLKRRFCFEPLDYILGETEFMGLVFKVSRAVLIPRPETEILVETVLKLAAGYPCQALKVLDLGTGSGCIAVSLAKRLPLASIDALDISAEALKLARENARTHKVIINFMRSDLFNTPRILSSSYQLIISNPPYIPAGEISSLQPEVRYEPRLALEAGLDGLDFYRRIIKDSPAYLGKGGYLALELGFGQHPAVQEIFELYPEFEIIEVVRDYSGIERVMVARKTT